MVAIASINTGTVTANIAAVMSRLRPSTSAAAPVNGAVNAMARVLAVIMALICAAETLNSCASSGNKAWGP
jgi:hypothetical protein